MFERKEQDPIQVDFVIRMGRYNVGEYGQEKKYDDDYQTQYCQPISKETVHGVLKKGAMFRVLFALEQTVGCSGADSCH